MDIRTVHFSHILETRDIGNLPHFLAHTAFVISHKSEHIDTLLGVLWYLPVNSPVIIVTNCPEEERDTLAGTLRAHGAHHRPLYLVHQKDAALAAFFQACDAHALLGADGRVVDGKGEAMYIGALCARLLGEPRWVVFYDADNFVPSALLEYTLAMSKLFQEQDERGDACAVHGYEQPGTLHNVRICWASKPEPGSRQFEAGLLGRCTRVISPLFTELLAGWFGPGNGPIRTSNAGEQGMTIETAAALRFSSGYSVETFQLLDLLFHAAQRGYTPTRVTLHQYLAKSPHFHDKKDDEHIKKMIAQSLGCFIHFEAALSGTLKRRLQHLYDELQLEPIIPRVYPALNTLPIARDRAFIEQYNLFADITYQSIAL